MADTASTHLPGASTSDAGPVPDAPLVAIAGLLHFATTYPIDYLGMVKGAYLVYVAPLLCALAGLGFQWSLDRSRVLAAIWIAALLAIAAYTLYCRVPLYVYPA